jgi:exonuclease III
MKYTTLRIPWRDIIFLNVLDPTEDKSDDKRGSFYDELERVFDQFPKYDMEIVLGDVNAKLKSEDIFKPKRR